MKFNINSNINLNDYIATAFLLAYNAAKEDRHPVKTATEIWNEIYCSNWNRETRSLNSSKKNTIWVSDYVFGVRMKLTLEMCPKTHSIKFHPHRWYTDRTDTDLNLEWTRKYNTITDLLADVDANLSIAA
jgi:hypothetical protein